MEINEARNGIEVERLTLNGECGGAGRYRGGKGIDLRYRILGKRAWLTAEYTRRITPPWGVAGGRDGSCNRLELLGRDGHFTALPRAANLELGRGDIVRIVTANGGGYGDPLHRPQAAVLSDIRNGYITAEEAASDYGLDTATTDSDPPERLPP